MRNKILLEKLQQIIVKNPADKQAWLVYSDYLQTQDIIQGELISLFYAYQETHKKHLITQIEQLIQQHWNQFSNQYWPFIQDAIFAPIMMIIPPGVFIMGGVEEDEILHKVTIEKPFAISKFAITVTDFQHFVKESQYITQAEKISRNVRTWQSPGFKQNGLHPVVCISAYDAEQYCAWLSHKTKKNYRLPTEAEWEYATKAATTTAYWWGNSINYNQANYQHFLNKTVEVPQYFANPWGLYQVHGNVLEWTCSLYDAAYNGYETHCSQKPGLRVLKGGCWFCEGSNLRSAFRYKENSMAVEDIFGFRVVRVFE